MWISWGGSQWMRCGGCRLQTQRSARTSSAASARRWRHPRQRGQLVGTASSDVSQQDATSVGITSAGQLAMNASHYLKEVLTSGCQIGGGQMYNMPAGLLTCTSSLMQHFAGFTLQGLGLMLLALIYRGCRYNLSQAVLAMPYGDECLQVLGAPAAPRGTP